MAELVVGIVNIIDEHKVAIVSPQGRNEPQITSQLSTCMWGSIIIDIGSQGQVVFWIEYMKFHVAKVQKRCNKPIEKRSKKPFLLRLMLNNEKKVTFCYLKFANLKIFTTFAL